MNVVYKYKNESGFETPERCFIVEMLNDNDDPDCSIAEASVKPGITTQLHKLKGITERYVILQGEGIVEVGVEEPIPVKEKDIVFIPADVSQRVTNTGTNELVFLCICTPRFYPESYVNME